MKLIAGWRQVSKRRRVAIGCGVVIVLVLTCAIWAYPVDRQSYTQVAHAFADSLLRNDAERAKSFAASSQWNRIDKWVAKHRTISCSFSWDPDDEGWYGVGGQFGEGAITATVSYGYHCLDPHYRLNFDEIVLDHLENGWLIVNWGKVCEERRGPEKCE